LQAAGMDISVAQMEVSQAKEMIKRRFHLRGFPSLVVFRKRAEAIVDDDRPAALDGKSLRVTGDNDLLLRASQNAKMGKEKNAARLRALGKEGEVIGIDLVDLSAQLSVPEVGKIWFPLEALVKAKSGAALPYHRSEASFMYSGAWKQTEMKQFMERMLAPLVEVVSGSSRDKVRSLVDKELFPVFFCCGGKEVTSGFVDAATASQGKTRSFHVPDPESCPAPLPSASDPSKPHVLVYSPAGQQWAPSTKALRSAVTIAGPEVVADPAALVSWIQTNAWPGIVELQFHNFADFVNAARHGLMVAVRGPRGTGGEVSRLVEKRLREVAKPDQLDPRTDLYTYGKSNSSHFFAVIDGSLDGLTNFGVSPHKLPRVVVFEGRDQWVEEETELTVEQLSSDLEKLPKLWKSKDGPYGTVLWMMRNTELSFFYYHDWCIKLCGPEVGPYVLPALMAGFGLYYSYAFLRLIPALVRALTESDPPKEALEEKKESKKEAEGKKEEKKEK